MGIPNSTFSYSNLSTSIRFMSTVSAQEPSIEAKVRLAKRKVALYLGYNGSEYHGMQINNSLPTIELELFKALCQAECVSQANSDSLQKIGFMRACRTDAGVHAAAQLVSFKMQLHETYSHDDIVAKIQSLLPNQIQVYGFNRVAHGFHAKNACDSRIYEYLIPTYVLQQLEKGFLENDFFSKSKNDALKRKNTENAESKNKECKLDINQSDFVVETDSLTNDYLIDNIFIDAEGSIVSVENECPSSSIDNKFFIKNKENSEWRQNGFSDKESIYSYRISPELLASLSHLLSQYQGTHNFHNFTIGKSPKDPSAKRYIRSFECGKPFIDNGLEWVSLKVHGSSFMLHQIRKMIGLVVLLIKTNQAENTELFKQSFSPTTKWNIPKVPGLGLLLERCFFDTYNKNPNCLHTARVTFDSFNDKILKFKKEQIYPEITKVEKEEMVFWNWMGCIQEHSYEYQFLSNNDAVLN